MPNEALLRLLGWVVLALAAQVVLMIATGAWLQIKRDRFNRLRIACNQRWEREIVEHIFSQDTETSGLSRPAENERHLMIQFMIRTLGILAGKEADSIRALYHELELHHDIEKRLISRHAKARAMAAMEVGVFSVANQHQRLLELLSDPVPHVAHAAARSLAGSGNLAHAEAVLGWVLVQDVFQRDRLLWIMEGFGPEILGWMEGRIKESNANPQTKMFYALLATSFRGCETLPTLLELIAEDDVDVQAASVKAIGAIGMSEGLPALLPLVDHPHWVIRAQVAKVLGILGGAGVTPQLLQLMQDSFFDVRRNAAYALSQVSRAGQEALEWVASDPDADPFARDLATERLQWIHQRGRS